jgi:hypothetical protein
MAFSALSNFCPPPPSISITAGKEEDMKTFLIIFWIHQAIFGLSSLGAVLNLLLAGGATNQSNLVPLLLAMIAGSLTWGFGFVMAERLRSWASQA